MQRIRVKNAFVMPTAAHVRWKTLSSTGGRVLASFKHLLNTTGKANAAPLVELLLLKPALYTSGTTARRCLILDI